MIAMKMFTAPALRRPLRRARRASPSASTSSSRSRAGAPSTAASVVLDHACDPEERAGGRARNAATATSFAALKAHGCVPPALRPCARARACGNVSRSGGSNSRVEPVREVERRRPASPRARGTSGRTRSARACPGSRGAASEAPSRKRTSACTTEVGWTTTSIRSYGSPKRKCASISSRPLFASVAESIVIFGPMLQVGCASASARRDVRELVARAAAERAARGGEDERARPDSSVAALEALEDARSARCRPAAAGLRPAPCAASASSPAATRLSLFASASVTPRSSAQSVAGRPAKPTTAFRTMSGSARVEQRRQVAADLGVLHAALASQSSSSLEPDASAHSSSSALRVDDVERLAPDRPRGAEDRNSLHAQSVGGPRAAPEGGHHVVRRRPRRRGARRCGREPRRGPPSSRPESFTSASRFSADSNRSPSGAAIAIAAPRTSDSGIERKSCL